MTDSLPSPQELKPCPFCGNDDDHEGSPWPENRDQTFWIVRCGNPDCGGEVSGVTPDEAVKRWNRRTL